MLATNLFEQYKSQSIQTLTKGELVVKLFEEASKQVGMAILLAEREQARAFNCVAKAIRILAALSDALDPRQTLSGELDAFYTFLMDQLHKANAASDTALMKELLGLIDELKLAFKQAERLSRIKGR